MSFVRVQCPRTRNAERRTLANVQRKSHVVWEGSLTEGGANISESSSGSMQNFPVTFASRFGESGGKTIVGGQDQPGGASGGLARLLLRDGAHLRPRAERLHPG